MASLDTLFEAAKAIQAKAYAPYSRFKVGAAIATPDGRVFTGCNVENAAYPVGSCAEAGAISAMIAAGESRITEIVVMGEGEHLVTPCGGCRQRIREFAADGRVNVHFPWQGGSLRTATVDELLPYAFELPGARAP
jgi:cytidine deaminase